MGGTGLARVVAVDSWHIKSACLADVLRRMRFRNLHCTLASQCHRGMLDHQAIANLPHASLLVAQHSS
jgi:hypothetical protein